MKKITRLYRLALIPVITVSVGCQSGGFSPSSLNPFAKAAETEPADENKIALNDAVKSANADSAPKGFTGTLKSAGAKTRDLFVSAITFGQEPGQVSTASSPADRLSLSNAATQLGPEVYVANGQLWESSGSFERAMDNYSKALQVSPDNGPALGAIARLHDRQNNLDQAIDYFNRAIKVDPDDPALYNDLGLVLSRQKNFDQATQQIQKAIAIAPGNKRFANNLATVYMDAGQGDKAMSTLASAHEPAVAHYNMAYLNFKRQQLGPARAELEAALKIDPSLEPARNLLDKMGGSQIAQVAQVAKDAYSTASSVGQGVQAMTGNVQNMYQQATTPIQQTAQSFSGTVSDAAGALNTQLSAQPPIYGTAVPQSPTQIMQQAQGTVNGTVNGTTTAVQSAVQSATSGATWSLPPTIAQ